MHIYLPTFLAKLLGLSEGYPMQMNLFGFKMLDSSQKGEIYSTDISDMIENGLSGCQDIPYD